MTATAATPRYPFIVETSPDDVFMAYAPDLPGCTAPGKTLAELRINAAEALRDRLYFSRMQGQPIPAPFSSDDILMIGEGD